MVLFSIMESRMKRLKELGTWVILVIAFYIFSNGLIYVCLQSDVFKNNNNSNKQVVNEARK